MIDLTKGYLDVSRSYNFPVILLDSADAESKITYYEELLGYSILQRAIQRDNSISLTNQEKIFPYIKHIIEWLRTTDFYTSPASTKYHDACNGGLLDHTLKTYNQLHGLSQVPKFDSVVKSSWASAVFVVLVHDWCKIGRYEMYYKRVPPNEGVPDWHQVPAFKYKEDVVGRLGHGAQSLIMVMQLCNSKLTSLSFEEMAAIRWHMDSWDIGHYDEADLAKCNETIPMVRMVQFADQLAITNY